MTVSLCFALFSGCKSKPHTPANSLKTPAEVVKVFCDLDATGTRLSSLTWRNIVPYITWQEEAMESAVVIISGYNIAHINKTESKAEILVEYKVIGKYWDRKFTPGNTTARIPVNVVKTDSGWKITNLGTTVPHIYPQVFLEGLESRAAAAEKEHDTEDLEQLRKDISLAKKIISK
jgi:hypothetical protein